MNSSSKPPIRLGIFLVILGVALCSGGIYLISHGDSPYFLVIGIGIASSGILLAKAKKTGLLVYGLTLGVIIIWSALETGANVQALLPRIAVPLIIGGYLVQTKIRETLL